MYNTLGGNFSTVSFNFQTPGFLGTLVGGTPNWYNPDDNLLYFEPTSSVEFHLEGIEGVYHEGIAPADTAATFYVDGPGDGYWSINRNQVVDAVYFDSHGIAFGYTAGDSREAQRVALTINQLASKTILGLLDLDRFMIVGGTQRNDTIAVGDFGSYIEGQDGDDTVLGGAGVDDVTGQGGNDTLRGDANDDRLRGGLGNDKIDGGPGFDTAPFASVLSGIVPLADTDAATAGAQPGWQVTSGDGVDVVTNIEILEHANGRSLLVGNGGFVDGNAAAAHATKPGDVIIFAIPPEEVTISQPSATADLTLAFSGSMPFEITTGSGDDSVTTATMKDVIDAGAGDDTLAGGSGDDTLTGGPGSDTFLFDTNLSRQNVVEKLDKISNLDHITDFSVGEDRIELDQSIFIKLAVGAMKRKEFFKGNDIGDAGKKVLIAYDKGSGELAYVAGKKDIVFAILDDSPNKLSQKDFDIVA